MIPKISSSELNTVLTEAIDSIGGLKTQMAEITSGIEARMNVLKNEQEFAASQMTSLAAMFEAGGAFDPSDAITAQAGIVGGVFDTFGSAIHPKITNVPSNGFNFITQDGYVFKNNMTVMVNSIISADAKEMLKHDEIAGKGIFFAEYDTNKIVVDISVDPGRLVGDAKCNMIEIVPFIAGSLSLDKVEVTDTATYATGQNVPDFILVNYGKLGSTRIMLDNTYDVKRLTLTFTVNYKNTAGKYPFGIKHLYLLNAKTDPASHIVAKTEKTGYIEAVDKNITLVTQEGKAEASLDTLGAGLYLNYDEGVLDFELPLSQTSVPESFTRNTKSFYLYMPITTTNVVLRYNKIYMR